MIETLIIFIIFSVVLGVFLFIERIKRKRTEEELKIAIKRKKTLRQSIEMLMDHSSDFYFRYDKKGFVNYTSSNVERLLGFKKSDGPVHFTEIVTDNPINNRLSKYIPKRFESTSEKVESYFLEITDKSGIDHMLEIFEMPHLNTSGKVDYVNAIARDLTGVYQAEMNLKESERKRDQILKALPDAMFMIDKELRYVNYQASREDQLWYKPSQFIGQKVRDVVPEHLKDPFEKVILDAFESGKVQTLEYHFGEGENTEYFEGRVVKLSDDEVLVISRDISNGKRLEKELRNSKDLAESATRAKSNFLATMSHEIRTPMNGVVGMISLLAETELSEVQKEYVETIEASGDTLLRIINDILDYSRIESGKLSYEESLFYLHKVIDDSLSIFKFEAQKKGIILNAFIEEDVPNFIRTDRGRLRQILLNLLSNAVKFTEHGSVILSVGVEKQDDNNVVLLFKVKDTGIGIPKDKLNGLFKEFTQLDTSHNRKFSGTGLGLAIVEKLVNMLHGKVNVKSEQNVGSTFSFSIRAKMAGNTQVDPMLTENGLQKNKKGEYIGEKYPLKLLLAEDNSVNRKLTLLFLERLGYLAKTVSNGKDVISALQKEHFDVVLLDISMPELDGFEVTERIKKMKLEQEPKIIGVSANAYKIDIDKAFKLGMSSYIVKPMKLEDLKDNLKSAYVSIHEPSS